MTFSVIIPTYKDWERLEKCIGRLLHAPKNNFDFEIIVVNNEENHSPPVSIKKPARVRIIHEPEPGSYAARNSGARLASGRYLAFTDADCLPDDNWLQHAVTHFRETECDLLGGRIDIFMEEGGNAWAYIYEKNTAFSQKKNVAKGHAVTANLIVKREVFEQLGGFDSTLKSGGDWDFSRRAVKSGFQLHYADDVIVKHPARVSVRAILIKQKRFAAWGYIKAKKKFGYSGLRILAGNLFYGIGRIFNSAQKPKNLNEKIVVFSISAVIYFYKSFYQFLFILKIINPEKIRD